MIAARERDRQALELRMRGLTFDVIAAQMGVSREAVRKAVARSLKLTKGAIVERADELRTIEAERLEKITEVLWPRVLDGDLKAIDRVLRARESFRRLVGLDLSPEPANSGGGDTYVLTSGDVSLVPTNGTVIDARRPDERPEWREAIEGEEAS